MKLSNIMLSHFAILIPLICFLHCFQLFYADVLCLLLFLAFLVGWGGVAYIGLRSQKTRNINQILFSQTGSINKLFLPKRSLANTNNTTHPFAKINQKQNPSLNHATFLKQGTWTITFPEINHSFSLNQPCIRNHCVFTLKSIFTCLSFFLTHCYYI